MEKWAEMEAFLRGSFSLPIEVYVNPTEPDKLTFWNTDIFEERKTGTIQDVLALVTAKIKYRQDYYKSKL